MTGLHNTVAGVASAVSSKTLYNKYSGKANKSNRRALGALRGGKASTAEYIETRSSSSVDGWWIISNSIRE